MDVFKVKSVFFCQHSLCFYIHAVDVESLEGKRTVFVNLTHG